MILLNHNIAGIQIELDSDIQVPHLLQPGFEKFLSSATEADIRFCIRHITQDTVLANPLTGSQKEQLYQTIGFPKQWLGKPVLNFPAVRKKIEECLVSPASTHIGLRWERAIIRNYAKNELHYFYPLASTPEFSNGLMAARFRNMLAPFLFNFSAFLMHGAGIVYNNQALLFLAPDEGGKSSLINLVDDAPVLSDDQVILRKLEDGIFAYATPFAPMCSGMHYAKLGGIFLLDKSANFNLAPLQVRDVVQFIWREHQHLWYFLPKPLRIRAFNLIVDTCQQAKLFRLGFTKNYVDWDAVHQIFSV